MGNMFDERYRFTHHTRPNPQPLYRPVANGSPRAMGSMPDNTKHGAGYNRSQAGYNPSSNTYGSPYGSRAPASQGYGLHNSPAVDLAALTHGIQSMNVQNQSFAPTKNPMMATAAGTYAAMPVAASMPGSLYTGGQYVYPANYGVPGNDSSPNMYTTPHASHFMPHMGYQGYQQHENSPLSQNWTPSTGVTGEIPTLITPRRDSTSSNENDQPVTPSYATYHHPAHGTVAINRTPSGLYAHSTPSPTSLIGGMYNMTISKQPEQPDVSPRIKMLVSREPSIPPAIPAPSSPLKPLDRALENQRGETNVYIRGLRPETDDETLEGWGARFGDVKSSKSIIDLNTGNCKGFGFVKYHNYEDAENCIRGFHYLGYEVSFARESFYSKLKAFADENNTNLYISNLPKNMIEHELNRMFEPVKEVSSSRILRNKNGHGRGVGFARFPTREACDEIIKAFNNYTIKSNGEEYQIQIRFADTPDQKQLKHQTQAARQFRSQEYEENCVREIASQAWRQARPQHAGNASQEGNEFDQHQAIASGVLNSSLRWSQYGPRQAIGRSPLGSSISYNNSAATPLVQVNSAPGGETKASSMTDDANDSKASVTPTANQNSSPVDSAAVSEQE